MKQEHRVLLVFAVVAIAVLAVQLYMNRPQPPSPYAAPPKPRPHNL